jgi:uncharacterized protein (DUF2147 family)
MKKLLAVAALLLASSAAQAQYTFEYGGKTIRVDPDRGTVQIPGVYDNTKKAKKSKSDEAPAAKSKQETTTTTAAPPPAAPVEQPAAAAAPPPPAPAPAAPTAVAAPAAPPIQIPIPPPLATTDDQSTTTASASPADNSIPPATSATPPVQQTVAPPPPPPAPTVAVAPPPAAPASRPAPAVAGNSPIGVWLTEEKEGKVRIEQCGANLCGYSVDKKTNQNGEQVLINMKPGKDKWSGRILDPTNGSTYDSTIDMMGTNALRVQGCAFGGVFCGGQTWTRVN